MSETKVSNMTDKHFQTGDERPAKRGAICHSRSYGK
jgi:hypothetical protein